MIRSRQSNTARLLGDPEPDRVARADQLRARLPPPREIPLAEWLQIEDSAGPPHTLTGDPSVTDAAETLVEPKHHARS